MLMKNTLLMAKAQTAKGTPATPTAGDNAILCSAITPNLIKAEFVARTLLRAYMGNAPALPAGIHRGIEFVVEMSGSGAAGTAPAVGPLLLGCGMAETISAGVSVVYAPVSSGQTYLTLICNLDGQQFTLSDAIGTVSAEMNPKGIPVLRFSYLGVYTAATDTAMPTGVSFAAFLKPLVVGRTNTPTFTLHGTSPCVSAFSFDLANQMNWRELIGCSGARRTDRNPSASLTIELPSVATKAWGESVRLGDEGALQVVHGTTAGNIVQLDAPKTTVSAEPSISDGEGVAMLGLQLALSPNTGNDELVLTFK
jgi:hypothetical protein